MARIGIIICDRYKSCEGGKCFRAARNREGAFQRYKKEDKLEIVAYTSCGGCPGGNVENSVTGMQKYGVNAIHFATGVLAGYPPCNYLDTMVKFIENKTNLPVIIGTHPMPTNYIEMHNRIGDWSDEHKKMLEKFSLLTQRESLKYDSTRIEYGSELKEEILD